MGEAGTFSGDDALARVLSSRIAPFAWDKIFRRAPLKDIRFPLFNRVEDAGYIIAACTVSRALKVIPDSLNLYSVNPESITWGSTPPFGLQERSSSTYPQSITPFIGPILNAPTECNTRSLIVLSKGLNS